MTPQDVFKNLLTLYPKKWDKEAQIKWAAIYAQTLTGIDGDELEKAYIKACGDQKYNSPPSPAEIRSHANVTKTVEIFRDPGQWPYSSKANQALHSDPECRKLLAEGCGLGTWEFISKENRLPDYVEREHIRDTNELFHKQYAACGTGQEIHGEHWKTGKPISYLIPSSMQDGFNERMRRREAILDKFPLS